MEPRLAPSAKIEHVGVYFAKMGYKIEDGFADIFGVVVRHLGWADGVFCLTFAPGTLKVLQTKEKMAGAIFMAQPSLFFPNFDFTLMNVYIYEYGDKVKLLISWKSVDFKPQF